MIQDRQSSLAPPFAHSGKKGFFMRLTARRPVACLLVAGLFAVGTARAEELRYQFLTAGKVEGGQTIRTAGNTVTVDYQFNDRGRGPKLHESIVLDDKGLMRSYRVTGKAYMGSKVDERFDFAKGAGSWVSQSDKGKAPVQGAYTYVPVNGSPAIYALVTRQILAQPNQSLDALPGGTLVAQAIETIPLEGPAGKIEATLYAVTGIDLGPNFVWLDQDRNLFAGWYGWSALMREGWESAEKQIGEVQQRAGYKMLGELATRLKRTPKGLVAIRNVRVFDGPSGKTSAPATVYVFRDRITQIDTKNAAPDEETEVIDGTGHTLLPGLVDMHGHESPWGSLFQIAGGVTSVRDLANDNAMLQDLQDRIEAGTVLGPRIWKAGFIDAKGPFSAPTGNAISTLEEGLRLVDWYAERGYIQIKLYSSLKPEWVAPLAAAAHERGMRVSGHVPAFMSAEQAVRAGYDEIQHINMVFLNFLAGPKDDTRTPLRFTLVGERAASVDLESREVKDFIALLKERGTVVDPTVTAFRGMFLSKPGEYHSEFAMIADHLPIAARRALRSGVLDVNPGNEKQYTAAADALLRMVGKLYEAGVAIVPGTDDLAGFTLHRELELYVQAGIPPARVLQLATIEPMRLLQADQSLGAVAPGKLADLILVRGDPSTNISDIRNVRLVFKNGEIYEPDAVYASVGVQPFQ
jgi:imidazolonepropionase-like amidohydrolase